MTAEDEDALSEARGAQATWDAAALVRAMLSGDQDQIGNVVERPGLATDLVMYVVADLAAKLMSADAEVLAKMAADPEKMLRVLERSRGPEPAERVPRDLLPPGPRLRGDTMRDAVALVELAGHGNEAAELAILGSTDQVGLLLMLAQFCAELAHEMYGDDLSEWSGIRRQTADSIDRE